MVGRFISGSLGHGVISTEIKATFAGCIDYGNLIHGDIDAFTVFESVNYCHSISKSLTSEIVTLKA